VVVLRVTRELVGAVAHFAAAGAVVGTTLAWVRRYSAEQLAGSIARGTAYGGLIGLLFASIDVLR
jgi:hypothetical protein